VTASVRGLLVACAIAALLVIAAIAARGRGAGVPADRTLVLGFRPEAVTSLLWERDGVPPAGVVRDPASPTGWACSAPRGAADARAIGDVLAALRGGRWHRRAPASAAGRSAAMLTVTGAGRLSIAIGEPLGEGQQWLAIGDRAYLVDAWLARALDPGPLALRVRRPLAAIAAAAQIQLSPGGDLGRVTLAGAPRRVTAPFTLLLDPNVARAIEQPLAELEIVALPEGPVAPAGEGIVADGVAVRDAGPCPGAPGRHAIDGTAGPGCVGDGTWENAKRATWTLTQPPAQLVERRPAPLEPTKLTLPDGAVLDLAAHPRLGARDADPVAAAELVAILGAPAEPAPLPAGKPAGALLAEGRAGGAITLDLYPPDLVVRRGEPIALRVGEGAFRRLVRPSDELLDPTPWREEPTTVTALELDGTTYTRGAVIGEWTRQGPGRDDPAAVSQLVAALAAPRVAPYAPAVTPRHTVTLRVQPPGGAPVAHTLRTGDPTPTACPALVDAAPGGAPGAAARLALPLEVCALVRALTR